MAVSYNHVHNVTLPLIYYPGVFTSSIPLLSLCPLHYSFGITYAKIYSTLKRSSNAPNYLSFSVILPSLPEQHSERIFPDLITPSLLTYSIS